MIPSSSYTGSSSASGSLNPNANDFICGLQVAKSQQSDFTGIYGIKIKWCPVVRCETLLDQGTVVTSKTEKLIEGDTKYEYLSIFPELLIDVIKALHIPGKCDTIQCKLLKDCDETDEIVSTDAQIVDTASGLA